MAFSQNSRSRLTVAAESGFGVLPTSPSWATLPIKGHTLDLTKARVQGQDILGDRMQIVDRHASRSVAGDIEVDLRRGDYDLLLESAFFSTFDTNDEIKVGTTPQYLRFEDSALDITQYRRFEGCVVNSMSVSIARDASVQTTFGIVGRNLTQAGSAAGGSPSAPLGYEPFDHFNGALFEGGVATANGLCIATSLTFSIQNNVSLAHVIMCAENTDKAAQIEFGLATIEGTLTVYYEDATLINKFLNETESELSVTVDDPTGTNDYTFYFPRVKYNGASVPVTNSGSRLIELPFVALKDSTEGTNLMLTRTSGT